MVEKTETNIRDFQIFRHAHTNSGFPGKMIAPVGIFISIDFFVENLKSSFKRIDPKEPIAPDGISDETPYQK
ncbi:hypothetical protein OGAPHI_005406 [Ogataea philodendri]|uniref:Uncharacterized protein n=1 Tax=Ogataea philodendri TaxID=1378263 RepID=A0A9P8NYB8_9ASCO|nr:uncharacterized protein OGAPHI_005406 [Ogataea philodendri]KAH3662158.1 hypothetical protein OGAPHI_005406 [Ogataea philodendri]